MMANKLKRVLFLFDLCKLQLQKKMQFAKLHITFKTIKKMDINEEAKREISKKK